MTNIRRKPVLLLQRCCRKVNATSGKIKVGKNFETTFADPAFNFTGYGSTGFYLKNKTGTGTGDMYYADISHDLITLFTTGTAIFPTTDYYQMKFLIPAQECRLMFKMLQHISQIPALIVYADSLVLDTWLDQQLHIAMVLLLRCMLEE
ncbi:MAG: hypothetical protein IPL12_08190 [Bacteroidetes bacterium]|nr:hypothetical protein [Bacteroidota bacterium]